MTPSIRPVSTAPGVDVGRLSVDAGDRRAELADRRVVDRVTGIRGRRPPP
jgi:hypothetical protein